MTLEYPFFKAFIQIEFLAPERLVLFDENRSRHLLEGKTYALLAPYLSKRKYSIDQIIQRLEKKISIPEIYYALFRLQEKGFLEETRSCLSKPIQALCNVLNVPLKEAESRLQNISIQVHAFGKTSAKPLVSALKSLSLNISNSGNFSIIVTDNYRHPKIRELFLHSKSPYLLIKPTSSEIWVGPLLLHQKTACLDCLLDAINRNSTEELIIERERKKENPITIQKATTQPTSSIAYHLAANEIFKWILLGNNPNIESKILSYQLSNPSFVSHQVIKKTNCSSCGNSSVSFPKPIVLESQKKQFTEDGGHRIQTPEETFDTYKHLISPVTGIIESLQPAYHDPSGLMHVFKAEHVSKNLHLQSARSLSESRAGSSGKGKTSPQAKTSCLCEAIERYSGIFQGNEYRKKTSYNAIRKDAIDPNSILLFSEKQYQTRSSWNQTCSPIHFVPDPFDPSKEVDWTPVWSMTENRFKWIPSGICYFSYPFPSASEKFYVGDSNGNAAGNTIEEAILQGFFELTERDSIAIWWYSRLKRPKVDLKSFEDPHIDKLIASYASLSRDLWVLDLTFDLNIPTFVAVSANKTNQDKILFGFGSHFDPKIAMHRALSEMNQILPFLTESFSISEKKNMITDMQKWVDRETLSQHPYLLPNSQIKRFQDYIRFDTDDLKVDIQNCQKIVEKKGLEMLILDQTRPDIKLSVVKVFVPGLRHFWNRYAPGRLYDVPLELNLIQKKLKEEELNPLPFFF